MTQQASRTMSVLRREGIMARTYTARPRFASTVREVQIRTGIAIGESA